MNDELKNLVVSSLEELKAINLAVIDLNGKADFADFMVIATGNSDRHLHAMADKVFENAKKAGHSHIVIEGEDSKDWVLVDLGDVIVHLMRAETRDLYALEKLWQMRVPKI